MTKTLFTLSFLLCIFGLSAQQAGNPVWHVFNQTNSNLPSNGIQCLHTDLTGALWVGTNNGIGVYNQGNWLVYDMSNSALTSLDIKDIATDQTQITWVATATGGLVTIGQGAPTAKLAQVNSYKYDHTNSGLPVSAISAIEIDDQDVKWIGTWGGGLVRYDGNTWTVWNTSNSNIPHNGIGCVDIDSQGNVWFTTYNSGLVKFDGSNFTVFNTALPSNQMNCLYIDDNDYVWVGMNGAVAYYDGTMWHSFDASTIGWYMNEVSCISQSSSGRIYVASEEGLGIYANSSWYIWRNDNSGLPQDEIASVYCQGDRVWIGTSTMGLAVYDKFGINVGINTDEVAQVLNYYPNPVQDELHLEISTQENIPLDIEIYTLQGQLIESKHLGNSGIMKTSHVIDLSHLSRGVYVFVIKGVNKIHRVVKL